MEKGIVTMEMLQEVWENDRMSKPNKPHNFNPLNNKMSWNLRRSANIIIYGYKYGIHQTSVERCDAYNKYMNNRKQDYINYLVRLLEFIMNNIYKNNNIQRGNKEYSEEYEYRKFNPYTEKDIFVYIEKLNELLKKNIKLTEYNDIDIIEFNNEIKRYYLEFHFIKYILYYRKKTYITKE